jgi:hypothetical protein
MSLRQFQEYRTAEQDSSLLKKDDPHIIARDQLIPRIKQKNRQAVKVDRVGFYYYQRKQAGRRCSCFTIEDSPDGLCQACFGTGLTGGFDKFGTVTEILDTTKPQIRCVNVKPDFDMSTRPVMFRLDPTATAGYVEADFEIRPSIYTVDALQVIATIPEYTEVKAYVKASLESLFVPLTKASLEARLIYPSITIRVDLKRTDPSKPLPILSHLMFRYKLIEDLRVYLDIAPRTESITLAEFGIFDSFTSITAWVPDQVKRTTTEDFWKRLDDGTLWKNIESKPNKPLLEITSHDLVLRLCQRFETYYRIP